MNEVRLVLGLLILGITKTTLLSYIEELNRHLRLAKGEAYLDICDAIFEAKISVYCFNVTEKNYEIDFKHDS